jgi:hypothetical protein
VENTANGKSDKSKVKEELKAVDKNILGTKVD